MSQLQRFFGFLAATAALALVIGVLGAKVLSVGGPAGEIITSLKRLERTGSDRTVGSGQLRSSSLNYQRISVTLDDRAEKASVSATLDFTGVFRREPLELETRVSSLGLERMRFALEGNDWVGEGPMPRLEAIVAALEARRVGIERGQLDAPVATSDGGLMSRNFRADAWFIRSERERVQVSEDWRLLDERSDRAMVEHGTTRLDLVERDGGFVVLP